MMGLRLDAITSQVARTPRLRAQRIRSSDVAVGKIGKQRFVTAIEPWHGNQVAVYMQKGREWERKVIDDGLLDGHTIVTGDFDGDGNDEIVAGFRGKPWLSLLTALSQRAAALVWWRKAGPGDARHGSCPRA